jgi:hypothetical protein
VLDENIMSGLGSKSLLRKEEQEVNQSLIVNHRYLMLAYEKGIVVGYDFEKRVTFKECAIPSSVLCLTSLE